MKRGKEFRILAIDGGGSRGIYAAQLLHRIEQTYQVQIRDSFDLFAGTSTGSIIAGAIASDISMGEIADLFESKSPQVFRKEVYRCPLFLSKYSKGALREILDDCLPSRALSDIQTPLMIMCSDIGTGGVYVFKSNYLEKFGLPYDRDREVQLRDAVMASCAAPTFFDPEKSGDYLLADGGLWANNPSIIALTEAMSKFKVNIEDVKILSIGNGHRAKVYDGRCSFWGFLTAWGRQKFIEYILDLQSQASTNMAQLLLNDRFMRLDVEIDDWALDDTEHLSELKALANRDFRRQELDIRAFINISGGSN